MGCPALGAVGLGGGGPWLKRGHRSQLDGENGRPGRGWGTEGSREARTGGARGQWGAQGEGVLAAEAEDG